MSEEKDETRYEIRVKEVSDLAKEMGLGDRIYVVWDKELEKSVPFGAYSEKWRAEKRMERMAEEIKANEEKKLK